MSRLLLFTLIGILIPACSGAEGRWSWSGEERDEEQVDAATRTPPEADADRERATAVLRPPRGYAAPAAKVIDVLQVRRSDEAARYELVVLLENPNAFPLPLTHADYRLKIDGQVYRGDTVPNATVPAGGQVIVRLPAVLPRTAGGSAYDVSGGIAFQPPGKLRELGYEMGLRVPRSPFRSAGTFELSGS